MRNINKEEFNKVKSKIDLSNINILRDKYNYSQVKLQHLVGVSISTIEAYCQNVRIPSLPIAYKLADIFNCSIDFIVGRETDIEKYYLLNDNEKKQVIELINELNNKNK